MLALGWQLNATPRNNYLVIKRNTVLPTIDGYLYTGIPVTVRKLSLLMISGMTLARGVNILTSSVRTAAHSHSSSVTFKGTLERLAFCL